MQRSTRVMAGLVVAALAISGCYGPFNLTRRLYHWNGQVSQDKWVVELVFIVCAWAPVYSLATLGDAVIFNSIEFWGGKNPIEPPKKTAQSDAMRLVQGETELLINRIGSQVQLEQVHRGQSAGRLRIERRGELTVATDTDGKTLFTAQMLPDGSVIVQDGSGAQLAYYTPAQVAEVLTSARR